MLSQGYLRPEIWGVIEEDYSLVIGSSPRAYFLLRNCSAVKWVPIALFTDNILHFHYNETEHKCEAISGKNDKTARNCLVSTLRCIVMQMSKVICEKGYYSYPIGQFRYARVNHLHCIGFFISCFSTACNSEKICSRCYSLNCTPLRPITITYLWGDFRWFKIPIKLMSWRPFW